MKPILTALVFIGITSACIAQSKVSTNGTKYVLLEYATSVHEQHSPDADYIIEQIRASEPRAICAAIHIGYGANVDSMGRYFSSSYVSQYLTSIPGLTADRANTSVSASAFSPGVKLRPNWATALSERLAVTSTFDINMVHSYNPASGNIIIEMTGTALTNLNGLYRFNLYILEDSVTGGPGYDQENFYNTQSGHPYFGAGNPIQGYTHMQVMRGLLYGSNLLSNPAANTPTTETFNYTLPAEYNPNHIRLVGIIYEANFRAQNCISAKLTECIEPPAVQICAASHNEDSGKTIITWDKNIPNVATYNIYKEGTGTPTPGQYQLLGSKSSTEPAYFKDIFSNPLTESSRYKITLTDSCGREKPLDSSIAVKTMLLTSIPLGSDIMLNWTVYEGPGVTNTQYIMRSVDGAPYQGIDMVGGATVNTHTSTIPPAGTVKYKIQRVSTICPQDSISSNVVTFSVGIIPATQPGANITLYPNPAGSQFNIRGLNSNDKVALSDVTGRMIQQWTVSDTSEAFDISSLNTGVYFVKVFDRDGLEIANLKLYHEL